MARLAQRDQILELFDGGKVDGHVIENSNQSYAYNQLERLEPALTCVAILRRNRRVSRPALPPIARPRSRGGLPSPGPPLLLIPKRRELAQRFVEAVGADQGQQRSDEGQQH